MLKNPSRLSQNVLTPKNNLVGSKPASRDVEEVHGESSYILLGYHELQQFVCHENLLFPSLILVVALPQEVELMAQILDVS